MFLKLLKTDFKYYSRNFVIIIVSVALAGLFIVFSPNLDLNTQSPGMKIANNLLLFISIVTICGAIVYTISTAVKIYNQKFISQESYLTFSLPIPRYQHFFSNMIVCFVWFILIIFEIIVIIAMYSYMYDKSLIMQFIHGCESDYPQSILLIVNFISHLLTTSALAYLCITLVNIIKLKQKSKLLGVLLFFVIIYFEVRLHYNLMINVDKFVILNSFNFNSDICGIIISTAVSLLLGIFYSLITIYLVNKKLEID